ncbi:hypothetical protein [Komagataeibacter oboediens]|uniref:hypothetical protein n=1 Tax=Komagataeibacter oboediens TaxID=65958 RepID=UPI0011B49B0A|nr:hypothetical protein [Komagataeibacter oboediens]
MTKIYFHTREKSLFETLKRDFNNSFDENGNKNSLSSTIESIYQKPIKDFDPFRTTNSSNSVEEQYYCIEYTNKKFDDFLISKKFIFSYEAP